MNQKALFKNTGMVLSFDTKLFYKKEIYSLFFMLRGETCEDIKNKYLINMPYNICDICCICASSKENYQQVNRTKAAEEWIKHYKKEQVTIN